MKNFWLFWGEMKSEDSKRQCRSKFEKYNWCFLRWYQQVSQQGQRGPYNYHGQSLHGRLYVSPRSGFYTVGPSKMEAGERECFSLRSQRAHNLIHRHTHHLAAHNFLGSALTIHLVGNDWAICHKSEFELRSCISTLHSAFLFIIKAHDKHKFVWGMEW